MEGHGGAGLAPQGRIDVVVLGMSPGCGVSTVVSGLTLMLGGPEGRQAHRVTVGEEGTFAQGPASAVLVAPGSGQPTIAELVASLLEERFDRLLLVPNRVSDADRWSGRADVCLPESRLGAALAGRGHRPPGAFGNALMELATLVERSRAG